MEALIASCGRAGKHNRPPRSVVAAGAAAGLDAPAAIPETAPVSPPLPSWLAPLLVAPFVGSFLGVLIRRLPDGRPVGWARSACEQCGHSLGAADLVPLASYALRRGRCRYCDAPIGAFHPAIELAAIGVAGWAALVEPAAARLWADCVLGWGLLALAWIDWQHWRLPDVITLPLLLLGLGATAIEAPAALTAHAGGAALGWAGLLALAAAYRALRGRAGLGGGDAKLLGAGGAWLGWRALPEVAVLGALAGIALALAQAARGRRLHAAMAVPFGPGLALAIWLWRLYGTGFG